MMKSSQKCVKIVYFFEYKYPEMQRKRIPRLNEYQSRRGTRAALTRRRNPPAHRGQGMEAFDIKRQPKLYLVDI